MENLTACSCIHCPVWGSRDIALYSYRIPIAASLTHTRAWTHTLVLPLRGSPGPTCWIQIYTGHNRSLVTSPVKSLHFRVTQMVMVHKACRPGGVGGKGLGIVINLCLVQNKDTSSYTNRKKKNYLWHFLWDCADKCVCCWLMVMFCLKKWKCVRNAFRQDWVGMKHSPPSSYP